MRIARSTRSSPAPIRPTLRWASTVAAMIRRETANTARNDTSRHPSVSPSISGSSTSMSTSDPVKVSTPASVSVRLEASAPRTAVVSALTREMRSPERCRA